MKQRTRGFIQVLSAIPTTVTLTAALVATSACWAAPPAKELIGTWDIVQVAVDGSDQPRWLLTPDDPELKYRELRIDETTLELNFGYLSCQQATWVTDRSIRLSDWLRHTYPRLEGVTGGSSILEDFELSITDQTVTPLHVICRSSRHDKTEWEDETLLLLSPDDLIMSFHHSAVFVLKRRDQNAAPSPSFDCKRAKSPSENSICESYNLAGRDLNVAETYRELLRIQPDDVEAIRAGQRAWLKERDACGTDVQCLDDSLRERVSDLVNAIRTGVRFGGRAQVRSAAPD